MALEGRVCAGVVFVSSGEIMLVGRGKVEKCDINGLQGA